MNIKKGELCPTCERYYDRHIVVEALIVHDGKVLLEQRNIEPSKGMWAMPGGYLDWNETGEEAVLREMREEIGAEGKVLKLLGVYSDPKRDAGDLQNVALLYLVTLNDVQKISTSEEVSAVHWFSYSQLPENIAFDHRAKILSYISHHV